MMTIGQATSQLKIVEKLLLLQVIGIHGYVTLAHDIVVFRLGYTPFIVH